MIRIAFLLPPSSLLALAGCGFSFCDEELNGLDESTPSAIIASWCVSGAAVDDFVLGAQGSGAPTCRGVNLNDRASISNVACSERFEFDTPTHSLLAPVAQSPNGEFAVAYQYSEFEGVVSQVSLVVLDRFGQQRGKIRFPDPTSSFHAIGVTSDGAHVLAVQPAATLGEFDLLIVRVSDTAIIDRHKIADGADYSLPSAFATVDLRFVVYSVRPNVYAAGRGQVVKPTIHLWDRQTGADTQLN